MTNDEDGVSLDPVPGLSDTAPAPDSMAIAPILPPAVPMPVAAPMGPALQPPTPPSAPAEPDRMRQIVSMALLGLAAGLGPRRGNGIAQGLALGQHQNDLQRQQQFRNEQLQYQQEQANYIREQMIRDQNARAEAALQQRRQQTLQQALTSIRNEVKTLPDKGEYDRRIEGYAGILQGSGYRLDANWLRQAIPYVAPSGKQRAQDGLKAFLSNPLNQTVMKNNPEAAGQGSMKIDLNGDGVAELVPIAQVMEAAGMSQLLDDNGQPIGLAPATEGPAFNLALKASVRKFRAENRREPDPNEMLKLVEASSKVGREPRADPDRPRPMTQGQRVNTIRSFQRDWNRAIQPVLQRQQATAKLDSGLAALDRGNRPAATEIILIAFQKMQDETSVVREAEYGRPGEMQSLRNRVEAAVSRLMTGGSNITDVELRKLAAEGKALSNEVAKVTERQLQDYRQSIEETLDEADIKHSQVFGQGTIGSRDVQPASPKPRVNPFRKP